MAKKITLKNKNGDTLCPHTAIEQVQGLQAVLDEKLGKTENVDSANRSKYIETLHLSNGTWYGDNYKAYIQWEDSNTAKLKIDGYFTKTDEAIDAINADKAKTLKTLSGTVQDLNNLSVDSSSVEYYGYLPGSSSNMPTHNAWQNSVMCFGLHSNGATAQMFFAKDKPLYYRSSHIGEWKQLRTMDDLVTTSHIADTAITSAKLASSLILKGTPQLATQPSLSSESQNIASVGLVKEAVDGIEVGGRNLALDSNVVVENNTYVMYKCNTSEDLETDREYTMTIWGTLGSDRDSFRLYDSGVSVALGTFTLVSLNRYVLTFKYKGNYPRLLHVLQFYSTGTSTSTIRKVKLERGNKATDYTLAPEEVEEKVATSINDKLEGYASIQYVNNKVANIGTPGNATETGAGIVRAATQAEVTAGHVSDNDPAEMAFVRPETLQSKLSNYPTTTAMTQAINESRQIIYYQSSQPSGGKDGDIWIIP